jgi:hypothetical protein
MNKIIAWMLGDTNPITSTRGAIEHRLCALFGQRPYGRRE